MTLEISIFDRKNRAAFTLIELMVVVAVIGILAMIAIPNYQKYRARSRQTEAKSLLSGVYTIEKTFFAEYSTFHWQLPAMGFIPESHEYIPGNPYLRVKTGRKAYYQGHVGIDPFLGCTDVPPITDYVANPYTDYNCMTGWTTSDGSCPASEALAGYSIDNLMGNRAAAVTSGTFEARMIGCPLKPVPVGQIMSLDRWSINQNRVLKNINSGI